MKIKENDMETNNRITKSVLSGAAAMVAVALPPLAEDAVPMAMETVFIGNAGEANHSIPLTSIPSNGTIVHNLSNNNFKFIRI